MEKYTPTENLFQIVYLLNTRPYTSCKFLQKRCNVSRRTVYRYINTLSRMNIPVIYDKKLKGYQLTRKIEFVPFFTEEECSYLLIAMLLLKGKWKTKLSNAFSKIETKLEYLNPHWHEFKKIVEKIINNSEIDKEDLILNILQFTLDLEQDLFLTWQEGLKDNKCQLSNQGVILDKENFLSGETQDYQSMQIPFKLIQSISPAEKKALQQKMMEWK